MHENFFAVVFDNKAKSLGDVEPLYRAMFACSISNKSLVRDLLSILI